jgi:hypothetical protein
MSGKGHFASHHFASHHFASGHWAGVGVEIVPIRPARYHTLIGPALTQYEIIGPRAGYTAIIGPGRGPYTLEG